MFRSRKPLHEQLADAGGLNAGFDDPRTRGPAAQPPGWDGEQRGEPGIHGVPRARRWDAVATVDAPMLHGDAVHFVALADGSLLVEEDQPDEALEPLADALEERLAPPYRAEAVRRGSERWAVAASRIATVDLPGLHGDVAELVSTRSGRELRVDGRPSFGSQPALERLGEAQGPEYVVSAKRLEDDLWEVESNPL